MAKKKRKTIKIPKGGFAEVIVQDASGKVISHTGGSPIFAEIGGTGLKRFNGKIVEEFLVELRGARGARIYTEMAANDGSIGSVIRATEDLIRSVGWGVELGGDTSEDEEARDFIIECMHDMSLSWSDFISEVISMIKYGWDWEEIVYKRRLGPGENPPSKYGDNRIGWRKIASRAQDSLLEWELDENGGIRGMHQQAAPDYKNRYIPIEKSILFRTRRNRNNPEGWSFLRNSYLPWYMKKNLQEIEGVGAERDFTGALVITLPQRATTIDRDKARDLIERWKIDEQFGAVIPFEWDIKLIASPGSKQIDTDKAILRYQAEIMMSFLAQFIRLGQVKVGTQALVTGQRDFFYLAITAIVDNIEETMNRFLIPPLIRLNDFGNLTDFPKLKHEQVGQTDIESFIGALRDLSNSNPDYLGGIGDEDVKLIRNIVGLPPLQEDAPDPRERQVSQMPEKGEEDEGDDGGDEDVKPEPVGKNGKQKQAIGKRKVADK